MPGKYSTVTFPWSPICDYKLYHCTLQISGRKRKIMDLLTRYAEIESCMIAAELLESFMW